MITPRKCLRTRFGTEPAEFKYKYKYANIFSQHKTYTKVTLQSSKDTDCVSSQDTNWKNSDQTTRCFPQWYTFGFKEDIMKQSPMYQGTQVLFISQT